MEDGNELDMLRKKNGVLDNEVLELKEKSVEDGNALDVLKTKNCELDSNVLELQKLIEKLVEDRNTLEIHLTC